MIGVRSLEPPEPSEKIKKFAETMSHGTVIVPDTGVWQRYLEPCFTNTHRIWDRLRGTPNKAGDRFDFELALVENKNLPNAVCGYEDGTHFILIYHTLPMFLLEFFNRLLCNSAVLNDVGNASEEVSGASKGFRSPPGFSIMSGEAKITQIDELVSVFGPRSPERRTMAFTLYRYAMEFVIEHEMAHAVNGHVHFAINELQLRGLDESIFRSRSDQAAEDRLYAFLEGMADKGSYFTVISGPILQRMYTPFQVLSSGDNQLVEEVKLKILAGAFLATFWMISDVVASGGDASSAELWNDHPSSLARAIAFCAMPVAQGQLLPEEVQFFLHKGTELAWKELNGLRHASALFRPFGWLGRDDMYSSIFEANMLAERESKATVNRLEHYRYRNT